MVKALSAITAPRSFDPPGLRRLRFSSFSLQLSKSGRLLHKALAAKRGTFSAPSEPKSNQHRFYPVWLNVFKTFATRRPNAAQARQQRPCINTKACAVSTHDDLLFVVFLVAKFKLMIRQVSFPRDREGKIGNDADKGGAAAKTQVAAQLCKQLHSPRKGLKSGVPR